MRVRTHGVELIQARMIGDTKSATLTFSAAPFYPRSSITTGENLFVIPSVPPSKFAKKLCRVRGHRTDVCPHPDRQICRKCGLENPSPEHPCELNCASCGGPHATGDRSCCTKRLKKSKAPRTPRPVSTARSTRQTRWFSSEDEEEAHGRATSPGARRATSCSRSRSRSYSKSAHHSPPTPCGRVIDAHADASPTTASGEKRETPAHNHGPETRSTAMPEVSRVGVAVWHDQP
ncbi:hypothetical protein MTO96_033101 [Rhipicephalus appendiculatus]